MSTTHQTKIASLRQQVASLQHALEVVNRNRRTETELLRIALDKSFEDQRSLQIDLDAARWSLKQLQSRSCTRAQEEPRTPVRLPPTPTAPLKAKAKAKRVREEEEDIFFVPEERGSRRARRQVRVAAAAPPAPLQARPKGEWHGRVHHDKYRFVTFREAQALDEAARQAEYAEFY